MVHSFMQDCDDPDIAVRKMAPIVKGAFISEEKPSTLDSAGTGFERVPWVAMRSKAAKMPVIYVSDEPCCHADFINC